MVAVRKCLNNNKTCWLLLLVFLSLLTACNPDPTAGDPREPSVLTIMAAASLTEVFTDLAVPFESAHPDVQVEFNFAGSQQLTQQLANGAKADIFASANLKQMEIVIENGRVNENAAIIFAHNRLIVVVPSENTGEVQTLTDLAKPGIKILLAAPEVPAGQYTIEFLNKASQLPAYGPDFINQVLSNVVSYETTVKAIVVKVGLGEADAGIVYATDLTAASRTTLASIEIPDELNVISDYFIAPVANGSTDLAALWIEFLQSETGEATLNKFGFRVDQ